MKNVKLKRADMFNVLFAFSIFLLAACSGSEKKADDQEVIVVEEEADPAAVTIADVWVIDEHQINDIPLTSKAKTDKLPAKPKESAAEKEMKEAANEVLDKDAAAEDDYEVFTSEALGIMMQDVAYEPIVVTESVVPLDETQTLVAYNKKGNAEDMVQVISSGPNNEVEQVIFTDKKHHDVFNVQAGMSGKEVKALRKDLKHLRKDGKSYLYNDSSNIMYLLEAEDMEGDVVTDADIDNMSVSAIIWKDKKHHNK